jgi:hypothetical protein
VTQVLHRQEPQFLRRNTFVHGCLGLLSLAEQCERLIVAGAGGAKAGPLENGRAAEPSQPEPAEGDDAIVLALLGVLRLSRELRACLELAAPARAPAAARPTSERPPSLRDFAR